MGQISEDINDGICCQVCGVWMEDVFNDGFDWTNPPGHPRTCKDCLKEQKKESKWQK